MTGESNHANVESEILAAKLSADPKLRRQFENLCFESGIPEGGSELVSAGWEVIILMR